MTKIVNLDDARKNWMTERADCLSCKHSWQAVFMDGSELGLECPQCRKKHGMATIPGRGSAENTLKVLDWCMKHGIGPYAPKPTWRQ